jgi:hypothetical protein
MVSVRRIAASLLTAIFLATALGAQVPETDEVVVHGYTFKYRRAGEALPLVSTLLSKRGTVELQPATNTLVIRDTVEALNRIVPVLRTYDHPARPLTLDIYIVRASRAQASGSPPALHSDLPDLMTRRLRSLLPYDAYEVRAQAQLTAREGQPVTYALAEEYQVSFRLGSVAGDRQVKLSDFQVLRRSDRKSPAQPLIHTNLNLLLDQATFLGMARSESSPEALMVVLTLRSADSVRRMQKAERP